MAYDATGGSRSDEPNRRLGLQCSPKRRFAVTALAKLNYNGSRLVGHGVRIGDVPFVRGDRTGNGMFMSNVEPMMDERMPYQHRIRTFIERFRAVHEFVQFRRVPGIMACWTDGVVIATDICCTGDHDPKNLNQRAHHTVYIASMCSRCSVSPSSMPVASCFAVSTAAHRTSKKLLY